MKVFIDYDFPNWNDYINAERSNRFKAAKINKTELDVMRYSLLNIKPITEYPVEVIFTWHFKDFRKDLDNMRCKKILDGFVDNGILKNDNLKCIEKITYLSVVDGTTGVEVEIK